MALGRMSQVPSVEIIARSLSMDERVIIFVKARRRNLALSGATSFSLRHVLHFVCSR
jgi:hypothetical protein